MIRNIILSLAVFFSFVAAAPAQVFVRAPFVRVYVDGPTWHVRAPFVNIGSAGYYDVPAQVPVPAPAAPVPIPPPTRVEEPAKGQTIPSSATPTLDEFARTFQATPGSHEVTVLNPVTGTPATVQFTLPDGYLRQVRVSPNSIEFHYGLLRFVRIAFDQNGPTVSAR